MLYFLDGKGYLDPETYVVGEPVTVLSREAEIPYLVNIIPLGSHQFPASEPPGNFFLESHLRHKI